MPLNIDVCIPAILANFPKIVAYWEACRAVLTSDVPYAPVSTPNPPRMHAGEVNSATQSIPVPSAPET